MTVLEGLANGAVYNQRQDQENEHAVDGHLKKKGKYGDDRGQRVFPPDNRRIKTEEMRDARRAIDISAERFSLPSNIRRILAR